MVLSDANCGIGSPVDTTIGYSLDHASEGTTGTVRVTYAREGNVLAAGAGIDAAAGAFNFGSSIALIDQAELCDRTTLCYVPAFSGIAAPWWDREAVGILTGISRQTSSHDVARAVVESVGHQIADIVDVIRSEGTELRELRADGGLTQSRFFVQMMCDLINVPIVTTHYTNLSAYGAARMCANGLGRLAEFDSLNAEVERFDPKLTSRERADRRAEWRTAMMRSRGQSVPQEGNHYE
jgi:Glycerol kinase